ncbi:MAG TPA: hypothetical protein VFT84_03135 [Gemmatimonadales bacterium]|nr:hypothetical protein [Gemmatimonadales bacterium]
MRTRASIVAAAVVWSLAACGGDDLVAPRPGQIRITTTTAGSGPGPDSYTLTLDDGAPTPIGANASLTLDADPGEHTLLLGAVPAPCSVEGGTSRTVTVTPEAATDIAYTVSCGPTPGTIAVTVATIGSLLDADGYTLTVDGGAPQPIGVNDALVVTGIEPGSHTLELADLALNCRVEGDNPVTVEAGDDHAAAVEFEVTCRAGVQRWTPVASGTPADLTSVWSPNDGTAFVVGERATRAGVEGQVLAFDGVRWSRQYSEADLRPRALWGTAADDVYLVGYGFFAAAARVLHYDGETWSTVEDFDREDVAGLVLESVWGSSATDVFVVGSADAGPFRRSLIYHFDGGGWLRMEVPGEVVPALLDVWGSGGTDVYAVGRDDMGEPGAGVVLHYGGAAWGPVLRVEGVTFNGVWGSGPDDVFAVGFLVVERDEQFFVSGVVWHYDGAAWSAMDLPEVGVLYEVWGTSGSDVYVVGEEGLILRYDGTDWEVTTQGAENLLSVWGGQPGEVLAVGNNGAIVRGVP